MVQVLSFDIGIKNMAYCYVRVQDGKMQFLNLNKIDLNLNKKANNQMIIDHTIEFLDNLITQELNIDTNDKLVVLIECQMTSIMKCIQTTINTYFNMIS